MAKEINIEERVHFTGFKQDRLSYLKVFDVFVLPSRTEGTPRCLMEAGAMEKAIIASDIPGCREIVKHNKTGLLFRPEDPISLQKCIIELFQNKDLRDKIGSSAVHLVEERFSAKRMAKEYEELYFKLVNK